MRIQMLKDLPASIHTLNLVPSRARATGCTIVVIKNSEFKLAVIVVTTELTGTQTAHQKDVSAVHMQAGRGTHTINKINIWLTIYMSYALYVN
jgi:hypothetical protein